MAQKGRPVVTCVGDGSAMYSIQALWTMAHHKLPITTVICNNGGYRIIKQRLKAFHKNDHFIGMDFADPPVDFVGLATSLGIRAERVSEPDAIAPAIKASIARGAPTLLDVIVEDKV